MALWMLKEDCSMSAVSNARTSGLEKMYVGWTSSHLNPAET
jgi:hypothetical protein